MSVCLGLLLGNRQLYCKQVALFDVIGMFCQMLTYRCSDALCVWFLQQPLQDGTDPDPYVKLYLLPDPQKMSKRKTKAARRTCNPTYNEMVWTPAECPYHTNAVLCGGVCGGVQVTVTCSAAGCQVV